MIAAATAFGVRFGLSPLDWLAWVVALLCLALGFSSLFLAVTASSTDWQTPGVVSNFITMPLMFASGALFPATQFPAWMQAIAKVNPISFSALLGRSFVLAQVPEWGYLGYLVLFAAVMVTVGFFVSARWLKVE
jgi:ABC-2 type transport system permease protein